MFIGGETLPDFSFDPWWLMALSLIPAAINVGLCCYVSFFLPRTKINLVFIKFLIFLAIWQTVESLARTASDIDAAAFFAHLAVYPIIAVPILGAQFILMLGGKDKVIRSAPFFIYFYIIPVILAIALTSRGYEYNIHPSGVFNWTITPLTNPLMVCYLVWLGTSALSLMFWSWQTYFKFRERKTNTNRYLLLALGFSAPILLGVIFEVGGPLLIASESVPVTNIAVLCFTCASFYTIIKNRLLRTMPKNEWKYILNHMDEGLMIIDGQNKIRFANRKACSIFECTNSTMTQLPITSTLEEGGITIVHSAASKSENEFQEGTIVTALGHKRKIRCHFKPFFNEEMNQNEVLLIISDVHQLRSVQEYAVQKSKDLSDFLYRASHDLKNPVVCIEGLLSIYEDATPEEKAKCIDLIGISNNKIKEILNAISSITKVTQHVMESSHFNLLELIAQRAGVVIAKEANLKVHCHIPENIELNTDKKLFTYIVDELILNAVNFKRPLVNNAFLDITLTEVGGAVILSFSDNGLGIPQKVSGEIFSVFFRAHEHSGKGLGLYTVKWTTQKLGFTITHGKTTAGLTRFSIAIPAERVISDSEIETTQTMQLAGA